MIPSGVQVFVALEPVDMRWSFDRLAGAALERVGYDARSGALFIYFGKRRDAVKILFFDGSGMCLFYKRLDSGTFRVPEPPTPGARHVEFDESLLDALLDGVDLGEAVLRAFTDARTPVLARQLSSSSGRATWRERRRA